MSNLFLFVQMGPHVQGEADYWRIRIPPRSTSRVLLQYYEESFQNKDWRLVFHNHTEQTYWCSCFQFGQFALKSGMFVVNS